MDRVLWRNSRTRLLNFLLVRLPLDTSPLLEPLENMGISNTDSATPANLPEVVSLESLNPGCLMQTVTTHNAVEQHFSQGTSE